MKYLLFALILIGCAPFQRSANKHLKIAERHLAKAMMKGAVINSDTVYVDFITKETITDTVALLSQVTKNDTIYLSTTKWSTKTVIRKDTIWQEVTCQPDTLRVPYQVVTEIKPDRSKDWHKYALGALAGIVLILIALAFRRYGRQN